MSINYTASLPWYDSEVKQHALDQFWYSVAQSLSDAGVKAVPGKLTRNKSPASLWQSPDLILSQCCGPDLFTEKGTRLCVVARPVFAGLDCTAGNYYSYIVSRTEIPVSSACIAVNSLSSRSGYTALTEWMDLREIEVSTVKVSGSHENSLTMLEQGLADLAAIDAHTINQLGIDFTLPVIGKSSEALSPPYVYHINADLGGDLLLQALAYAVQKQGKDIGITDIIASDRAYYEESFGSSHRDTVTNGRKHSI